MVYLRRAAAAIATVLIREGLDYAQSKAVPGSAPACMRLRNDVVASIG